MLHNPLQTFMRNLWAVNLVLIALACNSLASAVAAVTAWAIIAVPQAAGTPKKTMLPPAAPIFVPLEAVASRNLLGLRREDTRPVAEQESSQEKLAVGRDFKESELQNCSAPIWLRATIVVEEDAEASVAVVMPTRGNGDGGGVYTIADGHNQIADDVVLVAVRPREIIVRRRDHFERCLGEGEADNKSNVVLSEARPIPSPNAGSDEMPPDGGNLEITGVQKISNTDYRVERNEVNRVLTNLNTVATQARIVPSFRQGKSVGFKIFSIRDKSIFQKIGLLNGDIIHKVNGFEMNSVDRALQIYSKLQDATSLTIELSRNSESVVLNYAIVN